MTDSALPRREFLKRSASTIGVAGAAGMAVPPAPGAVSLGSGPAPAGDDAPGQATAAPIRRRYNAPYEGAHLNRVAFPMGGLGAGMICLEGTGALSHVSVRNQPDVFNEPCIFAAVAIKSSGIARVLEGPVPGWKIFGGRNAANGDEGTSYGLPRFDTARFTTRFPFGTVELRDAEIPFAVAVTGWSPFIPGDADRSSLPVAALEYRFTNRTRGRVQAVFSFNARNFLPTGDRDPRAVRPLPGGFALWAGSPPDEPWKEATVSVTVTEPQAKVNHAWFRGGWWDPLTMAWREVAAGEPIERPPITEGDPSPGGTIAVPFELAPGASRTIAVRLAWYSGRTNLRRGTDPGGTPGAAPPPGAATYQPWYAGRFAGIDELTGYWTTEYRDLREKSQRFSDAFYDSTLPAEVIEAVAANLTILKSPTILRQTDGRLWGWEGCFDDRGCCAGSCTHVWNYAQAIPHLFAALERTLRESEFGPSQDERGHQAFRTALPIRQQMHDFHAAADGQLGGIIKVHRDWRISGDTAWLRSIWPKVKASLDYCIAQWDPEEKGWLEEPHHNTYDIEFWGPDGMCTSFYLGALAAAATMAEALGEPATRYRDLQTRGTARAEAELFNGEYFVQKVEWRTLRASKAPGAFGLDQYSPEARALLEREGPKYQYGSGCLSDGVLGSWLALVSGVGQVLDRSKVASHLRSIHRYNLKADLSAHANPQRPSYAYGTEGGLLLCTWPRGGAPSLPFVYSDEVWTGIEYQVASHLMMLGMVPQGLAVVRTCRDRYDGRVRNPFDEYECGHWYARAMSSYALLEGLSGARYDAVDRVLHLTPRIAGDFRAFLATATGYATVGVRAGKPFVEVVEGTIAFQKIAYRPFGA